MTTGRFALTAFAAFVVSQVLTGLIHGFVLAADYAPFYGVLLRSREAASWQMLLLPMAHLSYVVALVWAYPRLGLGGSRVAGGLKIGLFGWFVGQAPLWTIWYAQQPWPGALLLKQLLLECASSLVVGITIALVAGVKRPSIAAPRAPATV
jgi:hypothetical protein